MGTPLPAPASLKNKGTYKYLHVHSSIIYKTLLLLNSSTTHLHQLIFTGATPDYFTGYLHHSTSTGYLYLPAPRLICGEGTTSRCVPLACPISTANYMYPNVPLDLRSSWHIPQETTPTCIPLCCLTSFRWHCGTI